MYRFLIFLNFHLIHSEPEIPDIVDEEETAEPEKEAVEGEELQVTEQPLMVSSPTDTNDEDTARKGIVHHHTVVT